MKRRFMFVGGLPSHLIGLLDFTKFGQVEELEGEQAADAARGGCVILPAENPAAAAFTPEELRKYASFGSHAAAPAPFQEKVRAARITASEYAAEADQSLTEVTHG